MKLIIPALSAEKPIPKQLIQNITDSATPTEFKTNLKVFETALNGMTDKQQLTLKLKLNTALDRAKLNGLKITPQMARGLNKLLASGLTDSITDAEARKNAGLSNPTPPVKQSTLPAVISKELKSAGTQNPEWTAVKHLPGYLSGAIRAMGRKVFSPFTSVPIEEIYVIANFNGAGSSNPNTLEEVKAVAGFLQKEGERVTDAELKFTEILPGYEASLRVYNASGYQFIVCKDFAGYYIYAYIPKENDRLENKTKQIK